MSTAFDRLAAADRYHIERERAAGRIVTVSAAEASLKNFLAPGRALRSQRRSVAARHLPLKRRESRVHVASATVPWPRAGFSRRPDA
jgi:hypothetical protein